jgi:transcriptional regulator with XRE-family HTH domain
MPRPRLESAAWWPELIELKDDLSLSELSEKFGVSVNGLSRALQRAGIERRAARRGRGPARKPKLTKGPDPRSAEAQEWWADFLALKDRKSLADLAKRFGVAEITLQRAMKRTGTGRKSQRGARGSQQSRKIARLLKPLRHLLGTVPDPEIASQSGLSRYAVAQYRRRHGIPSVRDSGGEPTVPEGAVQSPMLPREAYLVRVVVGEEIVKYVVVGRDLADAATRAQAGVTQRFGSGSRKWTIEALVFLGPAI